MTQEEMERMRMHEQQRRMMAQQQAPQAAQQGQGAAALAGGGMDPKMRMLMMMGASMLSGSGKGDNNASVIGQGILSGMGSYDQSMQRELENKRYAKGEERKNKRDELSNKQFEAMTKRDDLAQKRYAAGQKTAESAEGRAVSAEKRAVGASKRAAGKSSREATTHAQYQQGMQGMSANLLSGGPPTQETDRALNLMQMGKPALAEKILNPTASGSATNSAKKMNEMIALGVPEDIARKSSYGLIREHTDEYGRRVLYDTEKGQVVGQFKASLGGGTSFQQNPDYNKDMTPKQPDPRYPWSPQNQKKDDPLGLY